MISLAGAAIVVINVIYSIMPDKAYEKYVKFICGLILAAALLGVVKRDGAVFAPSDVFLEETFSKTEANMVAVNQAKRVIESRIEEELFKIYGADFKCEMTNENGEVSVKIYSDKGIEKKKLIKDVSVLAGLSEERIVIEYR